MAIKPEQFLLQHMAIACNLPLLQNRMESPYIWWDALTQLWLYGLDMS